MANWTNNDYVDSLLLGEKWNSNTLTYYLQSGSGGLAWNSTEIAAIQEAFATWSNVADLTFVQTANAANADLIEKQHYDADPGALGHHEIFYNYNSTSLTPRSSQLEGSYNTNGYGWDAAGLEKGGDAFGTLVHEIGHALGLDHTFADDSSDPHIFPGLTFFSNPFSDYGDNDLNLNIYSIMSYASYKPNTFDYITKGSPAGPMAFDIATIQYIYGANLNANSGDDVYLIPDANVDGTHFTAIWDTAGEDEIRYTGSKDTNIDLRPATIANEDGGGGYLSAADHVYGGFTIAADFTNTLDDVNETTGVIIEHATGGSGNDNINGNGTDNTLNGNSGADTLNGWGGDDLIIGGDGADIIDGGTNSAGGDTASYESSNARVIVNLSGTGSASEGDAQGDVLTNIENLTGSDHNDFLFGSSGDNIIHGGSGNDNINAYEGNDELYGDDGDDIIHGGGSDDTIDGGADNDTIYGNVGLDTIDGGEGDDTIYAGTTDNDLVHGGEGDDYINGQGDIDLLYGDAGIDTMIGGGGNDTMYGGDDGDIMSGSGNNDILYGEDGDDKLSGVSGVDQLFGGAGDDILTGGNGGDRLDGGTGNDTMNGGADGNRDVFVFALGYDEDRINGFEQTGNDRIELDDDLWAGNFAITDAQSVVDFYGSMNAAGNILTLDFGNGDILEVQNSAGIDMTTLGSDIVIDYGG